MFNPDSAIASLVAAHNADNADREIRKSYATPELPKVGTLDAKAFVLAMRQAGKRIADNGRPYTDQSQIRPDKIRAIAGFVGYDHTGNFGTQESSAMSKAQAMLNPKVDNGMTIAEQRAANRSMQGFTAGMPDTYQRKLADLRARETFLAESMLDAQKAGKTEEAVRLFALLGNVQDDIAWLVEP